MGDEAFIQSLYAEHGGALLRYALHLAGGDRHYAEDIVQQTMVRAWRHPGNLDGRDPRPWLFAVARNLTVDAYRARQSRPAEVSQAALADAPPVFDDNNHVIEALMVAEALAALKPDHRNVIIETYYRGRTAAEAASVLGIPAGTVKSRMYYALKALRVALQEQGLEP